MKNNFFCVNSALPKRLTYNQFLTNIWDNQMQLIQPADGPFRLGHRRVHLCFSDELIQFGLDGLCSDPDLVRPAKRTIFLASDVTGKNLTEAILHECLHFRFFSIREAVVEQFARQLAALLHDPTIFRLISSND